MKIEMSIEDLQSMLDAQRSETAAYITRNLTHYSWWQKGIPEDINTVKGEMRAQVNKSPYPNDFNVLKKYVKL